ncbi:MAG: isopentenyl-diphosphate Delta-isomerase [Candidatus Aenigmarchaeota archaeon]|nr:isopentenyl-diphosphate Delta-isomerase [Candidatus Aenigmarchaeota archaeon]
MEQVVLVDKKDKEIGYEEKYAVHRHPTRLHRAFSVFIFNAKNEMLITKRSSLKKTWPSFWSNTCCSHPRRGEEVKDAAQRRLKEELGIFVPLNYLFKFEYSADYDKEWGENEMDHVFAGKFSGKPKPDKGEIDEWKFVNVKDLLSDIKKNPNKYTPWFKMCINRVLENMKK